MRPRWRDAAAWLDQRTGLETAARRFLYEEIPASSGWHHVFGSVAVFLFLVQAFTGILLAINYAPTPGEAYNSLRYILVELTGGRLLRGLHHWGASMMIVVVVLHMAQVFLYGAYKKPRETTWMVGVVLFLLTMAYGLTGYLLPRDNRAYWGTVVATGIAAQAPVAGPWLTRLLGGEGAVGVVTFARFYSLHVLLLPPATALLIALHIFLVRRHGVAPAPGDEVRPRARFYPAQVFRDTVAIFIAFAILFTLAIAIRVPLGRLADPSDTSYIPRPEWYFLFLFQLLRLFEGPLEVLGSVVLPTLAVLALILVPFFDRGRVVRVTRRTAAFGVLLLVSIGWGALTAAALKTTPAPVHEVDYSAPTAWTTMPPEQVARLQSGAAHGAPGFAVRGAQVYERNRCGVCHMVNGAGAKIGPPLNGLSERRGRSWVLDHFARPQALSPGTIMPPYKLPSQELEDVTAYLFSLPE